MLQELSSAWRLPVIPMGGLERILKKRGVEQWLRPMLAVCTENQILQYW
jgi:hypothetical protein